MGEVNGDNAVKATYEETFMQQVRKEISNYAEYCFMTESLTSESDEPKSPSEALNGEHSDQWKEDMNSETWTLVPPPEGKNIVG